MDPSAVIHTHDDISDEILSEIMNLFDNPEDVGRSNNGENSLVTFPSGKENTQMVLDLLKSKDVCIC